MALIKLAMQLAFRAKSLNAKACSKFDESPCPLDLEVSRDLIGSRFLGNRIV